MRVALCQKLRRNEIHQGRRPALLSSSFSSTQLRVNPKASCVHREGAVIQTTRPASPGALARTPEEGAGATLSFPSPEALSSSPGLPQTWPLETRTFESQPPT